MYVCVYVCIYIYIYIYIYVRDHRRAHPNPPANSGSALEFVWSLSCAHPPTNSESAPKFVCWVLVLCRFTRSPDCLKEVSSWRWGGGIIGIMNSSVIVISSSMINTIIISRSSSRSRSSSWSSSSSSSSSSSMFLCSGLSQRSTSPSTARPGSACPLSCPGAAPCWK